jgi:hypothetical protein
MSKLGRFLLLGAVAVGIILALTAAPSSGGTRGQATGYGDSVLKACPAGANVAANGEACLPSLEVAAPASQTGGSGGDSNTVKYIFIAGMVLVLGGGAAYLISYTDFLSSFRRS